MRNLIFEDIEMKNFKLHEHMTFSFTPNRFVTITGDNGAGKSTIFSALTWALYDETIEGLSGNSVVRKKSGKDTSVVVNWKCNDDKYRVEAYRSHSKYDNERKLFKNDNDITGTTNKDTLKKISELIMPKDVFMNCLLFSQFVKRNFAESTYTDQRAILDDMLLLNKFEEYKSKFTLKISEKESEYNKKSSDIEATKHHISSLTDIYHQEEILYKNKKDDLYNNIERKNIELINICKLIESININEDELNELISLKDKYTKSIIELQSELKHNKDNYDNEMSSIRNSIEVQKINDVNSIKNILLEKTNKYTIEINELITSKKEEQSKFNKLIFELEKQSQQAKDRDRELKESELKPISDKISSINVEESSINKEIINLNDKLKIEEKTRNDYASKLNENNPICNACKQPLNSDVSINNIRNIVNELDKNINTLVKLIKNKRMELSSLSLQRTEISNKINLINDKYNNLSNELNNKILKHKRDIEDRFNKTIQDIDNKIQELSFIKNKTTAEFQNEIENTNIKYKNILVENENVIKNKYNYTLDIIGKVNDKSEKLKSINENILKLESIKNNLNNLNKTKLVVDNELKNLYDNIRDLDSTYSVKIANINDKINEYKQKSEEFNNSLTDIHSELKALSFWNDAFSNTGIKSILLDEAIPLLNEKARELCTLTKNIRVRFNSQKALQSGEFRNKFTTDISHVYNLSEGKELSSGEKRMANIIILLCMRHLLEVMQDTKMNILLLDEILDSLDPVNSAIAVDMIKSLSNKQCVVLISHTLRDFIESDESVRL